MASVFNTSYRVKADVDSEETRLSYNIEEGAYVTTSSGVWTVQNGEWRKIYPHGGTGSGLGWVRYDDTVYTEANKFDLALDTKVTIPNNAGNVVRSHADVDYYDSSTEKVTAEYENDLYLATLVFKYAAPNANRTFLRVQLEGGNGTPYERLGQDINLAKGNDVMHEFHSVFQYYADSSFLTNGATWKITAFGGTAELWDIIFFISKVQSYA
jgi:hypothetical protein